jgi:hypothetical protein
MMRFVLSFNPHLQPGVARPSVVISTNDQWS